MAEKNTLLSGRNLSKQFKGLLAVSGVDIDIHQGEIVGLIGPNGAGKSTTFNLLSGFLPPTTGQLTIGGADMTGAMPERISAQGLVRTFQHSSYLPTMTVEDNVLIGALGGTRSGRVARAGQAEVIRQAIDLFGLAEQRNSIAKNLPHGLQRLLSMAIAFAARPSLICYDEPLTGLNQTEVAETLKVYRRLKSEFGMSILLVEHNMRAVMSICDRIYVLHHGEIIFTGTPDEVKSSEAVLKAYLGEAHDI
ncbi:ABC transporter ATP-binding protein [Comamonas thiooxydans]|uniref:ABC transporter ATP-binding protein n=1 Tax=Comamonas thiooxydans TaxID=363952 RepID=UPI0005F774DB|nr:ABC transporter ATP-binding protein [Comamonas thiooxydans]CUB01550.1 amino acid/amide ABC transporter ATP-binding protein 1, HAAT family (TC 3.A.1.4.-) [Comamonas thiooxydans]